MPVGAGFGVVGSPLGDESVDGAGAEPEVVGVVVLVTAGAVWVIVGVVMTIEGSPSW